MSTNAHRAAMVLLISAAVAERVSRAASVRMIMTTTSKQSFIFGQRPAHTHELADGSKIPCNSPYCEFLDADPRDQENQRPPWSQVPR